MDKTLAMSVVASLCLCDNMGDVAEIAEQILRRAGLQIEWDDLDDLACKLGVLGARTLAGTKLYSDEDEDEEE